MPLRSFKFFPESFNHSMFTHPKPFIFSNISVSFIIKAKHWAEGENKIDVNISKFLFFPLTLKDFSGVERYLIWCAKIYNLQFHCITWNHWVCLWNTNTRTHTLTHIHNLVLEMALASSQFLPLKKLRIIALVLFNLSTFR